MADFPFLDVSRLLLSRRPGSKGMLPSANVRRSISTTYYALFHFNVGEACSGLLGAETAGSRRGRVFARQFAHAGLKASYQFVRGPFINNANAADFMRWPPTATGRVEVPAFARNMADAFLDAQKTRHEADYDFSAAFNERDARLMIEGAEKVMREWWAASTAESRKFKEGLYALMVLGGRLRSE